MPRLPRLTARQIIVAPEKSGFSLTRQSGSHMIFENADGKRTRDRSVSRGENTSSKSAEKHTAGCRS